MSGGGGGGFLGIGGESGFLNTGLFSSGPKKIKGFDMSSLTRQAEQDMIKRQSDIASGKAPSIAQMQYDKNTQDAARAAMAMAASQRGSSNPALAFRQAQLANQQAQMQAAQEGAILAEQERRAADDMIARQAAAERGVAFNAAQANVQNKLQGQQNQANMISGIGQGMFAAASDRNAKTDIKTEANASDAIESFVNAIKPYSYQYKDPSHGTGDKMGVMAQDLEKSAVGKTMVDEAPDGTKMIDTNKAIGAILAGMADLNKKIKKLEK